MEKIYSKHSFHRLQIIKAKSLLEPLFWMCSSTNIQLVAETQALAGECWSPEHLLLGHPLRPACPPLLVPEQVTRSAAAMAAPAGTRVSFLPCTTPSTPLWCCHFASSLSSPQLSCYGGFCWLVGLAFTRKRKIPVMNMPLTSSQGLSSVDSSDITPIVPFTPPRASSRGVSDADWALTTFILHNDLQDWCIFIPKWVREVKHLDFTSLLPCPYPHTSNNF